MRHSRFQLSLIFDFADSRDWKANGDAIGLFD
jgi:hypothetical protein